MKTPALLLTVLAGVVLAGCANNSAPVRVEPTYQEAASSQFIQSSRDAVTKLTTGFDMNSLGGGPVLVATVVNVNDLSRAAPLGRALSEQYATSMAASGFNVKEIKLRGDVFVREGQGELLLDGDERKLAAEDHIGSLRSEPPQQQLLPLHRAASATTTACVEDNIESR